MRKIFFALSVAVLFFFAEFLFANFLGRWFKPNLLLILVVYLTLTWGTRYSIFCAVVAGALRDSFSGSLFGIYLLPLIITAYVVAVVNRYFYHPESGSSKVALVTLLALASGFITYFLFIMSGAIRLDDFGVVLRTIIIPETAVTAVVTIFVFKRLRRCVLRLSA